MTLQLYVIALYLLDRLIFTQDLRKKILAFDTHIARKIIICIPITLLDVPIKSSLVQMFLLVNQPTTI